MNGTVEIAKRIGLLLRSIYAYEGTFVVCQALRLLPFVAVRSGDFRPMSENAINIAMQVKGLEANKKYKIRPDWRSRPVQAVAWILSRTKPSD